MALGSSRLAGRMLPGNGLRTKPFETGRVVEGSKTWPKA